MLVVSSVALADAGPPMILDDPGTPGSNKWEVNVASSTEANSVGRASEFPLLDVNYGLGERVELMIEAPYSQTQHFDDGTTHSGFDRFTPGVKCRFLDQETAGVSMSVFPQVVSIGPDAKKPGAPAVQQEVFLPINMEEEHGRFAFDQELGYEAEGLKLAERNYVLGAATSYHVVEEVLTVIGELHETLPALKPRDQELLANLGAVYVLNKRNSLLVSGGRTLVAHPGEERKSIGYFGVQSHF